MGESVSANMYYSYLGKEVKSGRGRDTRERQYSDASKILYMTTSIGGSAGK